MTYIDPNRELLTSGESTIARRAVISSSVASGNGNLRLAYFKARKTETIGNVRMPCGGTAMVAATLARIGIYEEDSSGNLTLVGSTASDTALWATINTAYNKALSSGFTKKRGIWYAAGALVVGTSTAPTFYGHNSFTAAEAGQSHRIGALLGGQTDLPSSISVGSLGDTGQQPYVALAP